jgi:hypothetical protein
MNWTPHIVSIGIFATSFLTLDYFTDAHWVAMYGGALLLTYVGFALLGAPGVNEQ